MSQRSRMSRRQFLSGAGTAICLPFFPSLFPRAAWADGETPPPPRRLMFMCVPLGFVPNQSLLLRTDKRWGFDGEGWFPDDVGSGYKLPAVHAALEPYREHISFLRGLSNRRYRGEPHFGDDVFLTCADTFSNPARAFSNSLSCDQVAAATDTFSAGVRHPSLALGISPTLGTHSGGLSWSESGVPIPPLRSPAQAFDRLFGKDDLPVAERMLRLRKKRSVLDVVTGQIHLLDRKLNQADRAKLDEVLSAVRGVETGITRDERWIDVPKPATTLARPEAEADQSTSVQHAQAMFDLAHAAFLTDSTRVITYEMPSYFREFWTNDKHGLNHGTTPESHAGALRFDLENSNQLARFIKLLCESKEADGQPLIHHTLAAMGSGCWGTNHYMRSLPLLLIGHGGGAIRPGATHSYEDEQHRDGLPMANLWLTMLQACGVTRPDADGKPVGITTFADSTGTLAGLT